MMKSTIGTLLLCGLCCGTVWAAPAKKVISAESGHFDAVRVEVVDQAKFEGGKGVALRSGVESGLDRPDAAADVSFKVKVPAPGRYYVATVTATAGDTRQKMQTSRNKQDALRVLIAFDDGFPRRRVLVSPWKNQDGCLEMLEKYDFGPGEHIVRLWLPPGAVLDRIELIPYVPPAVPAAAKNYQPAIVPPAGHPRIWVTAATLPQVKANLTKPENREVWESVREQAAKPFVFAIAPNTAAEYNPGLQNAAANKAFVALMTGDFRLAQEAADLMYNYMSRVEFGNMLDITRELGSAIYTGSLVYDWCYDFIPAEDRLVYRKALLRLAEDMEIGWPPFGQMIVNGHGNEAQVNRDLLAMGIALYGDENDPYRYCAYRLLEELIPMRAYEYQSNRHNQGIGYASFRFAYEMHAAWLLRRLVDREVFDPTIKTVYQYFLYGRLPDGTMMLDGDGSLQTGRWNAPQLSFLCYTYAKDPVIKGEFRRGGGLSGDPLLFLLLNDPDLEVEESLDSLPLTHYFSGALASMIARTGWNIGPASDDVFVEMKGAGYNFANHQHPDAGAFQIFYRGYLAADLGIYGFYGTPYDNGFNKRSIAHNVMLVFDPAEKFLRSNVNDGGQRIIPRCPVSLEDLKRDPVFKTGETLAADFGPNAERPFYSYMKTDLAAAYSDKVAKYTRTFCFLNLAEFYHPGVLIVVDRIATARPELKKFWSINSLTEPVKKDGAVEIVSPRLQLPGKLTLQMLKPEGAELRIDGGDALHDIFGSKVKPPVGGVAQAKGFRTMFSPKAAAGTDLFVAVMQAGDAAQPALPVGSVSNEENIVISIADRVVVLGTADAPAAKAFAVTVPAAGKAQSQLLLAGLAPGDWTIKSAASAYKFRVEAGKGTAFFMLNPGEYQVIPGASPEAATYEVPNLPAPAVTNPLAGKMMIGDRVVDAAPLMADDRMLVPAEAVFTAMGGQVVPPVKGDRGLRVSVNGHEVLFTAGSREIQLDGDFFDAAGASRIEHGVWYVCALAAGSLGQFDVIADPRSNSAIFFRNKLDSDVIWIDSNCNFDRAALDLVSEDYDGKSHYWAASGVNQWFELLYDQPKQLDAIGIRWSQGSSRLAKFKLEISDGKTWKVVHDGDSLKQNALELYKFPPQKVRRIRFTGNGNNSNGWNSIVSFIPQEAK
jgi:heparin/heparan-sulfate lyase